MAALLLRTLSLLPGFQFLWRDRKFREKVQKVIDILTKNVGMFLFMVFAETSSNVALTPRKTCSFQTF